MIAKFVAHFKKHKFEYLLAFFIVLYTSYFSWFTIARHNALNSYYYDLGIMDQTVFNTYKGRVLEMTSTTEYESVKRMVIHNDILLALLAPFYLVYTGPQTLLVIQSLVLALGAIPLYLLASEILKSKWAGIIFAFAYLLYVPLERANIFDFHAVTLATSLLLYMVYFAYKRKYIPSFIFFILALLTKEEVALTTGLFGIFLAFRGFSKETRSLPFGLLLTSLSIVWFVASIWYIIPYFRSGMSAHFALSRYQDFGDAPGSIIKGVLTKPQAFISSLFDITAGRYLFFLFAPLAFLSLLSPLTMLIAIPEFAINLLSNEWNMRNIIFHYTAVITPFVFISGICAAAFLLRWKKIFTLPRILIVIIACSVLSAYYKGPLPFSKERDSTVMYPQKEVKDVQIWERILNDENIVVSATGQIAPHFTDRKTFYLFSRRYDVSDYVLLTIHEINSYPDPKIDGPIYEQLKKDARFEMIYKNNDFEVYKHIK